MTPSCPWSKKAMEWFKKKKIKFEEKDIYESQNKEFRAEILEKTGQMATPVIEIDGEILIGFNEKKVEELLNKKNKSS